MDNKAYKIIIAILAVTSIVFASMCFLLLTKDQDKCKCVKDNCENNTVVQTTTKPVQSDQKVYNEEFVIKSVNGCSLMVTKDGGDYSVSFCEMAGSADMKFEVNSKIRIKYSELLETSPEVIIPLEYEIVK